MESPHFSETEDQFSGTPSPEVPDHSSLSPTMQVNTADEQSVAEHESVAEDTAQSNKRRKASSQQTKSGSKSGKANKKTKHLQVDPSNFQSEDVITLVEERPSLWNKKDPKHSDNVYNRRKWMEIYVRLFPDYHEYDADLQDTIGRLIQKRWRSVRDSFFKFIQKTNLPSGSAAQKSEYKHAKRLGFLKEVKELRPTTSNTVEVDEPILIEGTEPPTDIECETHSQYQVSKSLLKKLSQKHSSRKNKDTQRDQYLLEAFQKLEESITSKILHLDVRLLRLEGLVSGPQPSPLKDFVHTLIPQMERMTEEQLATFKAKMVRLAHECLNPTPHATPVPPPPPSPSPSIPQQRHRPYPSPYPPYSQQRYEDTFESEEGLVYRRV